MAGKPRQLETHRQSSAFDVLVGQWREAFEAAQAALGSAGRYLGMRELAEHRRRFIQERSDVARLLEQLGRDWRPNNHLAA